MSSVVERAIRFIVFQIAVMTIIFENVDYKLVRCELQRRERFASNKKDFIVFVLELLN
ncbi:hypothetical protein LCGC14_2058370 [marine sediment metagenome]|uniref:Uncharacterized protein n=1 Tax=marine sediment metagenome TaxID=412755 RepID=A0A0F9ELT8_9ZZZZ